MNRQYGLPCRAETFESWRRNVWCPRYDICLDHAARNNWFTFTCGGCDFQFEEKLAFEDWECCMDLIRTVFNLA